MKTSLEKAWQVPSLFGPDNICFPLRMRQPIRVLLGPDRSRRTEGTGSFRQEAGEVALSAGEERQVMVYALLAQPLCEEQRPS